MELEPRETVVKDGMANRRAQSAGPLRSAICRVVAGPDAGKQVTLALRPLVIGAGADCDLILGDSKVSRRHTQLRLEGNGVEVKDLGSTNGTYSQGSRISEAVLLLGSQLEVGETTLRLTETAAISLPPSSRDRFGGLVGVSESLREIYAILELTSPSEATLLIQGESGTGKELAARAVHDHSPRAQRPFVIVDCGAASEELIESQLFGHVKGAFTSAVAERKGAFLAAHGGTLFLDEVGELPLASQAKLLRALEARTVQPLGSDKMLPIDVRIIAATHRDLRAMVVEKAFRFDLFHRMAVVYLQMPPLRERPEDIVGLVKHFYEGRGVAPGSIEGENLTRLQGHAWPGNGRELRNVLDRAWVLSGKAEPTFGELKLFLEPGERAAPPPSVDVSLPFKDAKERLLEVFERRYVAALYERCEHNITRAAEHAGLSRRHFRALVQKHKLGSS